MDVRIISQTTTRGKNASAPTIAQMAAREAAQILLDADRMIIDKADRLFLLAVKRHGNVNGDGLDRIAELAWILKGGAK